MNENIRKRFFNIFSLLLLAIIIAGVLRYWGFSFLKYHSFRIAQSVFNISKGLKNSNRLIPEIIHRIEPSVVSVKGIYTKMMILPFSPIQKKKLVQESEGAGVIVSEEGYIVTTLDAIEQAQTIHVNTWDNQELQAKLMGFDPMSRIAVIQVKTKKFQPVSFANSDQLQVGQWVLAMGSPFGFKNSSNLGIISALGRNAEQDLIQTDAAINTGNRGGALIDLEGNLAGININLSSGGQGYPGVGFAVPSNVVKKVIEDLIRYKKVHYGWLGVEMQPLQNNMGEALGLASNEGVIVNRVFENSPAQKGGILQGDVIVEAGGRTIREPSDLYAKITYTDPNTYLPFSLIRDNRLIKLSIKIGSKPENFGE